MKQDEDDRKKVEQQKQEALRMQAMANHDEKARRDMLKEIMSKSSENAVTSGLAVIEEKLMTG